MRKKRRTKKSSLFLVLVLLILIFSSVYIGYKFKLLPQTSDSDINTKLEDEKSLEEKEDLLKKKKTTATILATGDIMFHSPQIKTAYNPSTGNYDFSDSFKHVKKYIEDADLSLGNLETVTAGSEIGFEGYPNFNSPVEALDAIRDTGYDILSTANNHCLDQGKKGLISTIDAIQQRGMKNVGTYKEPDNPLLIEKVNDISIGILSYTYGCNGMEHTLTDEELNYMVNLIDENKIKEDIEKTKEENVDLIVVFIHWGNEYQQEPSEEQIDLGDKMIDWGVDIVFGSHPHVIQESKVINKNGKKSFIIYSMGNFLSNQRRESINNKYTEDGIMVQIEVEKDFEENNTIIKNINYIPTWVSKYTINNQLKYEIIPVQEVLEKQGEYDGISKEAFLKIEESFNNTMEKMDQ